MFYRFNLKNFVILFLLTTIILGGLYFVASRKWESTASFIVLAKSEVGAQNLETITKNLTALPQKKIFYDTVIERYPALENSLNTKERDHWPSLIETNISTGSIVSIRVRSDELFTSQQWINASGNVFLQGVKGYYSSKDIEVRIFEDVETHYGANISTISSVNILLLSALIAIILERIIHFSSLRMRNDLLQGETPAPAFRPQRVASSYVPVQELAKKWWENYPVPSRKSQPKKRSSEERDDHKMKKEEISQPQRRPDQATKEPGEAKKPLQSISTPPSSRSIQTSAKKGTAPSNLPIAGEAKLSKDQPIDNERQSTAASQTNQNDDKEPTEEELKRRLSELLGGDV